ncbi:MAG: tannase/feruloyl esterase family alpha/beta hydrolase [Alphaproteobacteria bacterium]|nr:MAG: tannase/feruloyl esterase family alpha/beta hydrolase [Alphaproteobacteria bacterium]
MKTVPASRADLHSCIAHVSALSLTALLAAWSTPAAAGTPTSCESLASFAFPDTTINAAQSQTGGAYVAPDAWHLAFTNLPPYCEVQATIAPTPDSSIKVRVWMPTQRYNGRYLGTGNGGYAGGFFFSELADGINRGFATANTDMGATGAAGTNGDLLTGHPEKWKDFGWRATHLMTTFSKALINTFYGNPAQRSYFAGCSTGGQQALMEAQRFPDDYDGILAGAPAFNRTHIHTVPVAQYRATHATAASYIPATKLDVVNQAVLAQCRAKDGGAPADAFLTDPRICKFDPAALACPAGLDGPNCLNPDQVAAMKVYYAGSVNPATGALIHPGNARGSETSNPAALGLALNESLNEPSFDSLFKWVFGLTWQWQTFDFNHDVDSVDRVLAGDLNATSTDLRAFAGRGGKLVMYAGWADPLIPSQSSINYYNALAASYGGTHGASALKKTQGFARLFMAPGMWHCKEGPGPSSFGGVIAQPAPSYDARYDILTSLTQWVEQGVAPNSVIATKYNGDTPQLGIAMQRPICSYPQIPVYKGSGDPNAAASFTCQASETTAADNPKPAPQYGP